MCGIAGVWGTNDEETVDAMMRRLVHRGPDARGTFREPGGPTVLGHCRLAIVDPAGGDQPIRAEKIRHAIVANGEIYNSAALQCRLEDHYRFRTQSDSEAALALYIERGAACASDLDGMFAIVVSDGDDLFVARDPIGIKPLYIGSKNDDLLLASEIKALIGFADNVREFPPGSWFHSRIGTRTYYEVPDRTPARRTAQQHAARVRETLERSVEKRLMSDVPLGAFLSGGLDSSVIAALVRPHVDRFHTFSVGSAGSRDLEAARAAARHLDTVHHEFVLKREQVEAKLPEILFHLESFDQDLVRSAIPCYFTSGLAAQEVKVTLTGEGADELFAGYGYYRHYEDSHLLHRELRRSVTTMHNVNLQRVDRMTMAHSIEGRVPFLDTEMIELAQTIPPELKLKGNGKTRPIEKWVLRKAVEDLLPAEIVWRDKEQFDSGSGTLDLLAEIVDRRMPAVAAKRYSQRYPDARLRSPEECLYHRILCETYEDPGPILDNVARWSDRPAGDR